MSLTIRVSDLATRIGLEIKNLKVTVNNKEPIIVTKLSAFNKNFGTTAGTVAEGNDSRILNGHTAYSWGNHAGLYPTYNGTGANGTWGINISGNAASASNSTLFNGYSFDPNLYDSGFDFLLARTSASSDFRLITKTGLKSFLDLGSNAYTSTDYFKYETFTADANTLPGNRSAFTYALNAPNNGPIAHFAANGYGMQMNMSYGNNGNNISLRSSNGDGAFWNPWRNMWHDGNFNPANYLPLSGGTLSGNILFSDSGTTKRGIQGRNAGNDFWFVGGGATTNESGYLEIATGDDGQTAGNSEPIYVSQYGPGDPLTGTLFRRAKLLDENGNTSFPKDVTAARYVWNGGTTTPPGQVTTESAFHNIGPGYGYGISTNNVGGLDIMANQNSQPIRFWAGTGNGTGEPIQRMIIGGDGNVSVTSNFSAYYVTSTNYSVSNAIYFGGGNNYLNWTGSSIGSNVSITAPQFNGSLNGNASSASIMRHLDGPRNLSDRLPNSNVLSVKFDFVAASVVSGTGNYAGVMTLTPWTGTTSSTGDSSYQLAFMNESGINGSGLPGLKIRKGIDTTWGSWYSIIHSGNIASQSVNYANSANSANNAFGVSQSTGSGVSGIGLKPNSSWDARPGGNGALQIGYHTGVSIHGYGGYGGVRLYSAGYPDLTSSVLRLEASDSVKTFGGLYSDGNLVIHSGSIGSQSVAKAAEATNNNFYVRGVDPSIQFVDTDQGETRWVHHNGGSIGFLNSGGNWVLRCANTESQFYSTLKATAFYQESDMRLKDIKSKEYTDTVSDIQAISYLWKDKSKGKGTQVGYSAQQVKEYMPSAVTEDSEGVLSVNYIQVLIAKIESMEKRIKELEDGI